MGIEVGKIPVIFDDDHALPQSGRVSLVLLEHHLGPFHFHNLPLAGMTVETIQEILAAKDLS
jgi:hypothetical protein